MAALFWPPGRYANGYPGAHRNAHANSNAYTHCYAHPHHYPHALRAGDKDPRAAGCRERRFSNSHPLAYQYPWAAGGNPQAVIVRKEQGVFCAGLDCIRVLNSLLR